MNFTSNQFAAIVAQAKAAAANHPEWLRAIEKAARMLASGELCVTLFADDTALVTSPNGSYRVNGQCPCAARTAHCYHRTAKRIVELMDEQSDKPITTPATSAAPVRVPRIVRSVESGHTGVKYAVTYCDNWAI